MRNKSVVFAAIILYTVFSIICFANECPLEEYCRYALDSRDGAILIADAKTGEMLVAVGSADILSGERFFPPASVFKIVTAIAALEAGIDPDRSVRCVYWYNAPGGRLRCSWAPGHGIVDMKRALSISCSYYFYSLIDMGITTAQIHAVTRIMGFDEEPFDGISPVRWKQENGINFPYLLAVGLKGIEVSPYHILRMMFAVANEGILPDYRIDSLSYIDGISSKSWRTVKAGLYNATHGGIAMNAAPDEIEVAGKTGTAPLTDNPDKMLGWFAGYYPDEYPRYIIVVLICDGTGFDDAAPLAGMIFKNIAKEEFRKSRTKYFDTKFH